MITNMNRLLFVGLMSSAISASAQLNPLEPTEYVPVVNPGSRCQYSKINKPDGIRDYTFLRNSDCTAYFALPPAIAKKEVEFVPIDSLRFCKDKREEEDFIEQISESKKIILAKYTDLNSKVPKNPKEAQYLQEQKDKAMEDLKNIDAFMMEKQKEFFQLYGKIEGAQVIINLDSRVIDEELTDLSYENEFLKEIINDKGETVTIVPFRPFFLPAKVSKSIYSFSYRSPEKRFGSDSIISSNIPGLEILQQEGSTLATAHVKGGDVISAELNLSLIGACGGAVEMPDGSFEIIDTNKQATLVVSRSYEIQQQFKYGYKASLITDNVINQIVEEVITSDNKGFTKKQVFENVMTADLKSYLSFEWDSNFSAEGHNVDGELIMEIKTAVFAKYVDDYFDQLVASDQLEIIEPTEVEEVEGGLIDVDKVGTHCWTETKWLIKKTRKCADYTYKVKEWKDGITDKELKTKLTINAKFEETVSVNEMVPFYHTTIFKK